LSDYCNIAESLNSVSLQEEGDDSVRSNVDSRACTANLGVDGNQAIQTTLRAHIWLGEICSRTALYRTSVNSIAS
jgi:hypothetical protein